MTREEMVTIVNNNPQLEEFIVNHNAALSFCVAEIPIYIFKEDTGCSYYYRIPYKEGANYADLVDFMKYAIPYLSKKLEERRNENLLAPGNVIKATPRYNN